MAFHISRSTSDTGTPAFDVTLQVRATNDMSFSSKYSMVREGYVVDEAVNELAGHLFRRAPPRRAPLVHFGYFVRHRVVGHCIDRFVDRHLNDESQILSLGAGFDTTYFRLKKTRGSDSSRLSYYEVDLPDVVANKIGLVANSLEFSSTLTHPSRVAGKFVSLKTDGYSIFSHDLNKLDELSDKLLQHGFDFSRPTLVLSECAITYMEESSSTKLIEWAAAKLPFGTFVTYEQVNPDDAFGHIMTAHFERVQAPLKSVAKYRRFSDQRKRYIDAGWAHCRVYSAMNLIRQIATGDSFVNTCKIEPFDEWEQLHLTCCHYSLSVASHSAAFVAELGFVGNEDSLQDNNGTKETRRVVAKPMAATSLERYGHKCLWYGPDGEVLVIGGEPRQKTALNSPTLSEGNTLSCVHHTCTCIAPNQYVLFGGRTSPNKEVNTEPTLLTLQRSTIVATTIEVSGQSPRPRWRHSAVATNSGLLIFGGRNARLEVFADLWEMRLNFRPEEEGRIITSAQCHWVERSSGGGPQPCPRFSQAMTATDDDTVFLSGGLDQTLNPLDDIWKLTIDSPSERAVWTRLRPSTAMRSVYGHTMHFTNDKLLFVGGVSTTYTDLPQVTVLDLVSLQLQHFSLETSPNDGPPLLHNHDSELCERRRELNEDSQPFLRIYGGGGNCFTFGTHFNRRWLDVLLADIGVSGPDFSMGERCRLTTDDTNWRDLS